MKIVSFTGIGRRNRNEDAYAVVEMPEQGRTLAIVCDGMGGHGYGDEASQTVVKAISNYWTGNPKRHDSEKKIVDAVAQAGIIYEKKTCGREMGTTLTMVAIEDGTVHFCHCGDSRIYFCRKSGMRFYTNDHTRVSEEGWVLVTNCFFTGHCLEINPDIRSFKLEEGDRIMLCSDGVYGSGDKDEMWAILKSNASIENVAKRFEDICAGVSSDNYTAVIIEN